MKKILALLAVCLFAVSSMAYAGGGIYASKIIGSTGMVYDLNLNETVRGLTVFADGKFSSDVDGVTKIFTDKISGGATIDLNDTVATTVKYSEDYRGGSDLKILDVSASYTMSSGVSIKPSIERNVVTNDNQYLVGVGYKW